MPTHAKKQHLSQMPKINLPHTHTHAHLMRRSSKFKFMFHVAPECAAELADYVHLSSHLFPFSLLPILDWPRTHQVPLLPTQSAYLLPARVRHPAGKHWRSARAHKHTVSLHLLPCSNQYSIFCLHFSFLIFPNHPPGPRTGLQCCIRASELHPTTVCLPAEVSCCSPTTTTTTKRATVPCGLGCARCSVCSVFPF